MCKQTRKFNGKNIWVEIRPGYGVDITTYDIEYLMKEIKDAMKSGYNTDLCKIKVATFGRR